jgi:probable F420-dependent oxidoreductase
MVGQHGEVKIRFAVSSGAAASNLDIFGAELQTIEALGFDTVWMSDIPLGATLDPIVGLSFAAGITSSLKLGTNLVPIGRNPLTLAKSLAQLDQLSGGRLLLSFVVGLDQPGERQTLGLGGANRGRLIEEMTPLLRTWWAGEPVTYHSERYHFSAVPSPGRSRQDPLEVWLGGSGPEALARIGRLADGWLGSAMTPSESGVAREQIEKAAAEAGRVIDPEHFGLSIPYASSEPDQRSVQLLRGRRPDVDLAELFPVGPERLRTLVSRYVDAGLSKFVVRTVDVDSDRDAARAELADILLPMQS